MRTAPMLALLAALGVGAVATACGSEAAVDELAIERELFIAVYIDLRVAAMDSEEGVVGDAERSEILARHGVTADDLTNFGEVHGERLEFMREVWNEVEARMDTLRPDPTLR